MKVATGQFQIRSVQWAIGAFGAFVEAMLLILPEQFGYLPSLSQAQLVGLGVGTSMAPILSTSSYRVTGTEDLFALTDAAISAELGVTYLLALDGGRTPLFAAVPGLRPAFGICFLMGEVLLSCVVLRASPRWLIWLAHLAVGCTSVAYALLYRRRAPRDGA
jgi:hypothetical protein